MKTWTVLTSLAWIALAFVWLAIPQVPGRNHEDDEAVVNFIFVVLLLTGISGLLLFFGATDCE